MEAVGSCGRRTGGFGLEVVPGMPAEAFISTGERSALSCFVKAPIHQVIMAMKGGLCDRKKVTTLSANFLKAA